MSPRLVPRPKTTTGAFVELILIVGFAIGLALLIQAFIVKPFQIPTPSMVPTLEVNQRVLVNRMAYRFGEPGVGDIVVFKPPRNTNRCAGGRNGRAACAAPQTEHDSENFIKRIVAGPGDRLRIDGGRLFVNGDPAEEDFTRPCEPPGGECDLPEEIVIPPDHYFMMGDNRGASDDSRRWGPVHRDWIIGKTFATYWPPRRVGFF